MAITQIANIYEPTPFNKALSLDIIRNNEFLNSGLIYQSSELSTLAAVGGRIVHLPFWNPLGIAEPNYSTDDATTSTAKNITMDNMKAVRHTNNESWATANLTRAIAGSTDGDPIDVIVRQVSKYWQTDISRRISSSLAGIILDNIANDSGDMVNDVASETIAGQSATTRISAENIIDTMATMGEVLNELTGIIMHRVVYTTLQKLNLIDFIPDSEGRVNIPTYLGMRVFVDNYTTTRAGTTDGTVYYTYLFGSGAIAYSDIQAPVPSALDRKEDAGTGEGIETLFSRNHKVVHPMGFDWQLTAGTDPTYATLALATSWDRVYDRDQIKIACLISN